MALNTDVGADVAPSDNDNVNDEEFVTPDDPASEADDSDSDDDLDEPGEDDDDEDEDEPTIS